MKQFMAACAILSLAGCGSVSDSIYSAAATVGNKYCAERDQAMRDAMIARINRKAREQGASWTLRGVDCDHN